MSNLLENYLSYYNNFIEILLKIFNDDITNKILLDIQNISDNQKIKNGLAFNKSISNLNFRNFIESKIKLVSHKNEDTLIISQSLFNNKLYLKDILNNQTTEIKKIIWLNLHTIYLAIELLKPEISNYLDLTNTFDLEQNKQQILQLEQLLSQDDVKPTNPETKTIQHLLNVEVNNQTNEMLDDIVGSFQNILGSSNPMAGILDVSKKISLKYSDKINNGDIELEKLMTSIGSKVPGIGEMMKMMPTDKATKKPEIQYVMDENFSTSSVPVGDVDDDSKKFDLGNMLKMADNIGVIPGGKQTDGIANIPGMEHLQTLLGFVKKIDGSNDSDNINDVKQEMDSYFQNNLGIDINQFNDDIKKIV